MSEKPDVRKPAAAGTFYPGDAEELRETAAALVQSEVAPVDAWGVVLPHAGYVYSGKVAGATLAGVKLTDTVIILGPNHTGLGQPLSIMSEGAYRTPLGDVPIDSELAAEIRDDSRYLAEDSLAHQHEHSIEVQLPLLQSLRDGLKLVPIVLGPAPPNVYQEIGRDVARTLHHMDRSALIIASSDMTHYEPAAAAETKDMQAIEAIRNLDAPALAERIKKYDISMCGYGPVMALIAAAKEQGASDVELVSYKNSGDASGDYDSVVGYAGLIVRKSTPAAALVELARRAIATFIKDGKVINPPSELTPEMKEHAGVFVSLHKDGELRGCIGTIEPGQRDVAREVILNAISAAARDPRFEPVTEEEVPKLEINVDVLTTPEPVASAADLDVKKYGLVVECGRRRGLLLPDIEGVGSVAEQIEICKMKGGINPGEKCKLYRFEVKRYR